MSCIKAADGYIWVWSRKTEIISEVFLLDRRIAGHPAHVRGVLLEEYGPKDWVYGGYIEQQKREEA